LAEILVADALHNSTKLLAVDLVGEKQAEA
jgi:hypothetical protein